MSAHPRRLYIHILPPEDPLQSSDTDFAMNEKMGTTGLRLINSVKDKSTTGIGNLVSAPQILAFIVSMLTSSVCLEHEFGFTKSTYFVAASRNASSNSFRKKVLYIQTGKLAIGVRG
ncbi:hypothetical protein FKW77_004816 [Venturia effusa]|uniref:Uncharacterized protein n=1 Tax=Venturia effusa TaxID=50376 RepID=A0A517LDN4_9PEZI|nr:hypothetical protein FKW77_004816 [Venturia effusa]